MNESLTCPGCAAQINASDKKCVFCGAPNPYHTAPVADYSTAHNNAGSAPDNTPDEADIAYEAVMNPPSFYKASGVVGKAIVIIAAILSVSFLVTAFNPKLLMGGIRFTGGINGGGQNLLLLILLGSPILTTWAVRACLPKNSAWRKVALLLWPIMQTIYLCTMVWNLNVQG